MRYFFILSALAIFISAFSFSVQTKPLSASIRKDTLQEERDRYMKQVLESIKGKEKWDADSVFKNLKTFKGVKGFTARHFLLMMNIGWGKGLGISCTYCHNPDDWSSDEKPQKEIARQMYEIRRVVNQRLEKIANLQSSPPLINCITCHREKPIPLTD